MLPDFSDSSSLLVNAQNKELYKKLVDQLRKDFVLANISIELSDTISPSELKTVLHEKLYFLILEQFSKYLNLLYVIDVPEKAFKDIHMTDAVEVAEQVTFLVLKRELQKVWLKSKYSQK